MPQKRGHRVASKEIIKLVASVFDDADSLDKENFKKKLQASKEVNCLLAFFNKNLVRTTKVQKQQNNERIAHASNLRTITAYMPVLLRDIIKDAANKAEAKLQGKWFKFID